METPPGDEIGTKGSQNQTQLHPSTDTQSSTGTRGNDKVPKPGVEPEIAPTMIFSTMPK